MWGAAPCVWDAVFSAANSDLPNGIIANAMREGADVLLNVESSSEEDLGAVYKKQKRR